MTDNLKLEERLANARLLRTDALQQHINDPSGQIRPVDEKGRTPLERYRYWCGVVDTYEFLVKLAVEVGVVEDTITSNQYTLAMLRQNSLGRVEQWFNAGLVTRADFDSYLAEWNATPGRFSRAVYMDGAIRMYDRETGRRNG